LRIRQDALLHGSLTADKLVKVDLCWCSDSGEACASRDFGATFAGVDFIRSDRSVTVVTVRLLLTDRDAVAGHSSRATEMLKALWREALSAFRKPCKQGQEARLLRRASRALFFIERLINLGMTFA
jgi:hypothetical protein